MTQTYRPVVLVDTTNLSRDEWLAHRRCGIGGSDAAAVLGISPWRTARDLYYDKLGIAEVQPDEENWVQLEMGNLLEPLVARIFEKKTGLKVFKRKAMFQHPQYPWMLADLDYLVELPDGSTAILEIKTTNYNARDNWWYNGEEIVPVYYESQGRHYMAVMNIDRVYFCCLYGNREDEAIIRHIDRDEAYEEELILAEQTFWQDNVLARTPPPYVEDGDLIMESLRRWRGPSEKDVPPTQFALPQYQLIRRYMELVQEKSRWDADLKEIDAELSRVKAQIIAAMGQSSSAVYDTGEGGFKVTYNPVRKLGITKENLERLKEVHPDIYAEYVTTQVSRRFNIKETKPEAA